jgi:tetratricopeptide (TPR) repeat protein
VSGGDDNTEVIGPWVRPPRRERVATQAGQKIGRFVVDHRIGAGGMGVVYVAHDPQLARDVAIKLLLPDGGGTDGDKDVELATQQARLLREAQAMARLNHPNVVSIYEVGIEGDTVFLAMELVEGQTLKAWLDGSRSHAEILRVIRAAGAGLAAAHEAGVIHRDFKPDNVLLGKAGRVLVSDFGLARAVDAEPDEPVDRPSSPSSLASPITQNGLLVGTPAYMAPEQLAGAPLDARTDQFSFCVVLYEALYGERPFDNFATELRDPPDRPEAVPAWLRRVLLRGLSRDRDARYASMTELLAALADDPSRRRRAWGIGLGVGAVVAVGITGVVIAMSRGAAPQTCDLVDTRLAEVWDPATKQRVHEAFTASGAERADALWGYTEQQLDRYATGLLGAYRDACITTKDLALQLRLACLDERLDRLRTIAELMRDGDRALIQASTSIISLTSSPLACSDATALALSPPPPPGTETTLRELRREGVRAEALELVNKPAAFEAYATLIPRAEQLGYDPLTSDLLSSQASMYARDGNFERSVAINRKALELADRAHLDVRGARIASDVLVQTALLGRPRAEVDQLMEPTRLRIVRAGSSLVAESAYVDALGMVAFSRGDFAMALPRYERALELARLVGSPNQNLALRYNNLGAIYEELGRYEDAIVAYREAMTLSASVPARDKDGHHWILRANLVWVYANLGRVAEAKQLALELVGLADKQGEMVYSAIGESFLANILIGEGAAAPGEAMLDRALAALAKLGLEKSLDSLEIYRQAALAYAALGNPTKAQAQVDKLFAVATPRFEEGNTSWVPYTMVAGVVALRAGQFAKALPLLERSLTLAKQRRVYPGWPEEIAFRIAQALVGTKGDRARANQLSREALTALAALPARAQLQTEIAAWRAAQKFD